MKRSYAFFALALIALVGYACTERASSPLEVRRPASLSFAPTFSYLGSNSFAPINRIRLTARSTASNAVLVVDTVDVDPADQEWALDLDVPADAGSVIVLIELINVVSGIETIEWSGQTDPITVQPGAPATTAPVVLFQGPPANLGVTAVSISPNSATVLEGDTVRLTPTILSAISGTVAIWSSLDSDIATVNPAGLVTTLRNGTARIVAVAGPRADTVIVNATQRPASIALTPDTQRVASIGSEAVFVARVLDPRNAEIAGSPISWSVANGAVAEHLGNGRFRAKANGTTTISATSSSLPAVRRDGFFVVAQRAARVDVAPGAAALTAIGAQQAFTAVVLDANGNAVQTPVLWRTSNAAVVSINASGLATATGTGSTEIRAVAGAGTPDSLVGSAQVSVAQNVATINVEPAGVLFPAIGDSMRLNALARDANGNVVSGVRFTWTSSSAAASVDSTGMVRAANNGTATVSATFGITSGTASITVAQQVARIAVSPVQDTVEAGDSAQFSAAAYDANGNVVPGITFEWTSTDTLVATVSGTGRARSRRAGVANIRAAHAALSAQGTLHVISTAAPNLKPTSLSIVPAHAVTQGDSVLVSVVARNTGNAPAGVSQARIMARNAATNTPLIETLIELPVVAAGDSVVMTRRLHVTPGVDWPDSITIQVALDVTSLVAESDESDNVITSPALIITGVANLTAISVTILPPDTLLEGSQAQVSIVVRNAGTAASPAVMTRLTVVNAGTTDIVETLIDTLLATPALAEGDSVVIAHSLAVNANVEWPHDVAFIVHVDAANLAVESSETDNSIRSSNRYVQLTVPRSLSLSTDSLRFRALNDSATVSATVRDRRGSALPVPVVWSSSNPAVATADSTGLVVSHGAGHAWLRAQAGTLADSIAVVVQQLPNSIVVAPDSVAVAMGATVTFTATSYDENGAPIPGTQFQWSSSDTLIANVDQNGVVETRAPGHAVIAAQSGVVSGNATIVVTAANLRPAALSITPADTVVEGGVAQLAVVVRNDGNAAAQATLARLSVFDAGDGGALVMDTVLAIPAIAAHDSAVVGHTVSIDPGISWPRNIHFVLAVDDDQTVPESNESDNGLTSSSRYVKLTVPHSLSLSPDSLRFTALNDSATVSPTVRDRRENVLLVPIVWSSSNPAVATVDSTGLVVSHGAGHAWLRAQADTLADSIAVVVQQLPNSIVVAPDSVAVAMGATITFTATTYDENGAPIPGTQFQWSSSDTLIANVDQNGVVETRAPGHAVITAQSGVVSGNATIVVTASNLRPAALSITPADTVVEGGVAQLAVVVRNDGNAAAQATLARLSVFDAGDGGALVMDTVLAIPAIAAHDSAVVGHTVSIDPGISWPRNIHFVLAVDDDQTVPESNESDNGLTSSSRAVRLTVARSLSVSPDSVHFDALGITRQVTATVYDNREEPLATPISWSTSDSAVATVDAEGRIVAQGPGAAFIVAQAQSLSESIPVVVRQTTDSVSVAPDTLRLSLGGSDALTAHAYDSNGRPIAGAALVWRSHDESVATVDSMGLVRAQSAGVTAVSASSPTDSDVSASATVIVSGPNLTTVALEVVPADTIRDGDSLHVRAVIRNTGGADAGSSSVRFKVLNAGSAAVLLDTLVAIPSIAAGDSVTLARGFLFAPPIPIDSIQAVVSVDASGQLTETDEDDNTLFGVVLPTFFATADFILSPTSAFLYNLGDTVMLRVTSLDRFGRQLDGRPVSIESRNAEIATATPDGTITALSEGETFVIVTAGAVVDSIDVHVAQQVTNVNIEQDTIYINAIGDTAVALATLYDSREAVVAKPAFWGSLDPGVASVDTAGRIVGHSNGVTRVHAHRDLGADTVVVIVQQIVANVSAALDSTVIFIGDSAQLSAVVSDSNGVPVNGAALAWSSSDTLIVRVDTLGGKVFGRSTIGAAWVRVAAGAGRDSVLVRVIGPAGVTRIWRGISSNWNDANNWSPAGVPTTTDTVLIRTSVPFAPLLSATSQVGGLQIESGTQINLGAFDLLVSGDIRADGSITSTTGVLHMTSGGRLVRAAALPNFNVPGAVRAIGSFQINGNLSVPGEFDIGAYTVAVTGNASTTAGSGSLKMMDGAGLLRVAGNMTFAGASSAGRLIAGTLEVSKNLLQNQPCGYSISPQFSSSGTFVLAMRGTTPQTMAINCPSQSTIRFLTVDNPAGVTLTTDISVTGSVLLSQGQLTGANTNITATVAQGIGGAGASALYRVPNTVLPGVAVTVWPDSLTTNLSVTGSLTLPRSFKLIGNFTVRNSATVDIAAHTLLVTGNFALEEGNTRITMSSPDAVIDVAGNAVFRGASLAGHLTHGRFRLGGDFLQNQPCGYSISPQYAASNVHLTQFYGTNQLVVFNCPSSSRFADLMVHEGTTVTFSTDAAAAGNVTVDGSVTGSHTLTVSGNLNASATALLSTAGLTIAGTLTAPSAAYNIGITTFSGTNQTITPALNYNSLYVSGTASLSGTTAVNGGVQVDGTLHLGAHTMTVSDSVRTINGTGAITMQHDSSLLVVARGVNWSGRSTAGLLTAGRLRVGGNFHQNQPCGYSISPQFSASGTHMTIFDGGAGQQTIRLNCPSSSRFQNVRFANSTAPGVILETDIAVLGSVVVEDGTVTGANTSIRATIANGLTDVPEINWLVPNTTFSGSLLTLPDSMRTAVTFTGATALPHDLRLIGNLDIRNGADVIIGPYELEVTGNFQTLESTGMFTMMDPAARVIIGGNLTLAGNTLSGRLTAGELKLAGNFHQNQPCGYHISPQYRATGTHRTVLTGGTQTIYFGCPSSNQFQELELASSTAATLNSNAVVGGSALVNGSLGGAHQLEVIGDITAPSGATLAVGSLSIRGLVNASAATYTVPRTIFAGTAQTIAASLNYKSVDVTGAALLSGATAFDGDLNISGSLNIGAHTLTVSDSLRTINNTGVLIMQDAGLVLVGGNANFSGNTTSGLLTAGTLRIAGNFHQNQPCGYHISPQYAASGTHLTVFDGAAQTVRFNCTSSNQFRNLEVAGGSTVTLLTDARVTSGAQINGAVTGAHTLTVDGNLTAPAGAAVSTSALSIGGTVAASAASYDVGLTTFTGTNQPILPALNYKAVSVTGSAHLTGTTTFDGNADITGSLSIGQHTLSVTNNLRTINNTGVLIMQDNGLVDVGGDASFSGNTTSGLLTAGTLRVAGNFHQNQPCGYHITPQYAASGTHLTVFDGAAQTVRFNCASSNQFRNLEVAAGSTVTLLTDARVTSGAQINGAVTGAHTLTVDGNLTAPAGAAVSTSALSIGGTVAASAASYDVGLTTFTGTNQPILPALNYKAVSVTGSAHLTGITTFDGNADITGSLSIGQHTLSVTNNLRTINNTGVLIMQDNGLVDVGGDASFSGNTTSGLLTAGTLRVAGNFHQNQPCGYHITPQYAASGTHLTVFDGAAQTVRFNCASSNQFRDLEILAGATVTLLTDARVTGNVNNNGTITGPFTLFVGGNLSAPAGAALSTSGLTIGGTVAANAASYDVGLTTFTGTNQPILPALNYKRVRVNGSAVLGGQTRVDGSLLIAGSLNVSAYQLEVTDTLSTVDNVGVLIMQHGSGVVTVGRSVVLYGGSTNGLLTAGTLRFAGNLYQNQPCGYAISPQFAASGNHITELTGTAQQITFNCPTSSQFGTLVSTGTRTVSGTGFRTASVDIDHLTIDNVQLTISGGTVIQFDHVTLQNFAATATQLVIHAPAQNPVLNDVSFLTTPTTGWYLATSGGAFTVQMNRTQPANHGGRVTGTATVSGWSP